MYKSLRPRDRSRRGTQAIEFALCLPPWLLTLSMIFDIGWLVFHKTSLDAAVNEGCRLASLYDPGPYGQSFASLQLVAEQESLGALSRLTKSECLGCSFEATLIHPGPDALRCELSRDVMPLAGLGLGTIQLRSVQLAVLQWQH